MSMLTPFIPVNRPCSVLGCTTCVWYQVQFDYIQLSFVTKKQKVPLLKGRPRYRLGETKCWEEVEIRNFAKRELISSNRLVCSRQTGRDSN